jgi:DNA polymerase-3 subunit alpha/error-prone DNA polymerase
MLASCATNGIDAPFRGLMQLEGLESKQRIVSLQSAIRTAHTTTEDFINRVPIGIEGIQILIFIGAFRFTTKTKNQLLVIARLILVNFKPETGI